jgi:hypothetical protein
MMSDPYRIAALVADVCASAPGSMRALREYEARVEQHAHDARMLDRSGRFLRAVERVGSSVFDVVKASRGENPWTDGDARLRRRLEVRR